MNALRTGMTTGRLRLTLLAALLLAGALPALGQSSPPPPPATDRIPSTDDPDTFVPNLYPRWLPPSTYRLPKEGTDYPFDANVQEGDIDPSGVLHVIGLGFPTGGDRHLIYANNRPETRKINGLSDLKILKTYKQTDNVFSLNYFTIAAGPKGKVAAAWIAAAFDADFNSFVSLNAMEFTPANGWGDLKTFTAPSKTDYVSPNPFYDPNGVLHIVMGRTTVATNPDTGMRTKDDREIVQMDNLSGSFTSLVLGSALNNGTNYPDYGSVSGPLGFADANSGVHVSWMQFQSNGPTGPQEIIKYRLPGGGTQDVTSPTSLRTYDMYVNEDGDAGFAYVESNALKFWGRSSTGAVTPAENVPMPDQARPFSPAVGIDGRKQPVVVYVDNNVGKLNLAMKVKEAGSSNPVWERQDKMPIGDFQSTIPRLRFRGPGQAMHLFSTGSQLFYTRQVEHNLGNQDSYLTYPAGPNASANLGTGNLLFQLPLFSSRGPGFAAGLALLYNSLDPEPGPISGGWNHTYTLTLTRHGFGAGDLVRPFDPDHRDDHSIRFPDGHLLVFKYDKDRHFWLPPDEFGYFAKLEFEAAPALADEYLLTEKTGMKYIFSKDGRVREIRDSNNNVLKFDYGANPTPGIGKKLVGFDEKILNEVTDSMQRKTQLQYDDQERLVTVKDPANGSYELAYDDTTGLLKSVQFAGGAGVTWTFEHHADNADATVEGVEDVFNRRGFLSRVSTPRGATGNAFYEYYYLHDGRLRTVRLPQNSYVSEGGTTESVQAKYVYSYLDVQSTNGQPPQKAIFRNRRDHDTTVEYEYRRCLATKVTDVTGGFIQRDFASGLRNLTKFTDQRGAVTTYAYVPKSGSTPDYVADNLQSVTRPGASTTTYTYTSDNLNRVASITDAKGNKTEYSYDGSGNLLTKTYPQVTLADGSSQSAAETFQYDAKGRVTSSTSPNHGTTSFQSFDSTCGLPTSILLPGNPGAETTTYHPLGLPLTHTLPGGGTTTMTYDGLYRLQTLAEPAGTGGARTVTNTYDEDSNVTQSTDNQGLLALNSYDVLNRLISVQNSDGRTATTGYDREGNVRNTKDFLGATATKTYDRLNRPDTTIADVAGPVGGATTKMAVQHYDLAGNVTSLDESGSGVAVRTTSYEYDLRGNVTKVTYPEAGIQDVYKFDVNDNLLDHVRQPGGGTGTAADFNHLSYDYDERDRIRTSTVVVDGRNLVTRHVLDAEGNQTTMVDPEGRSISATFDLQNRPLDAIDGSGTAVQRVSYTGNGMRDKVQVANPSGPGLITAVTYTYNALNQLTKATDALGNATSFEYDVRGNMTQQTDPRQKVTRMAYDSLNRMTSRVDAQGSLNIATGYDYDANGNVTAITVYDPSTGTNSAVYRYDYDHANRRVRATYPGGIHAETWVYNGHGELETYTDANGQVVRYGYDGLSRRTAESRGSPFNKTITRVYNATSTLRSVTQSGSGAESGVVLDYDSGGRLLSVAWSLAGTPFKSVSYSYDDSGNRLTMLDPESVMHSYVYDENNRLRSVSRANGPKASYFYDAGGRLLSTQLSPDGVSPGPITIRSYDARGLLSVLNTATSGNATLASYNYAYDQVGNRTRIVMNHLAVTVDYTYDLVSRLTGETWTVPPGGGLPANTFTDLPPGNESGQTGTVGATPQAALLAVPDYSATYTYDNAGNRTVRSTTVGASSYTYDSENRLTSEVTTIGSGSPETIAYGYDANGNQVSRQRGAVRESFVYDYANRLTSYLKQGGAGTPQAATLESATYAYMVTGERVRKHTLVAAGVPTDQLLSMMYDGPDVVTDYASSGAGTPALAVSYLQSLGIDSKLARVTAGSQDVNYYVPDGLGSVAEIVGATQQIRNQELTTAWGEPLPNVALTRLVADRHGFVQRERDVESGLLHFRARSYDPRLGRFIQSDPIRSNRPSQHYTYAGNAPTTRVDPLGLWDEKGMLSEFDRQFGERGKKLLLTAIAAGYSIQRGNFWFDDWDIDDSSKVVGLASSWWGGLDSSNDTAAKQLYQALNSGFESVFGNVLAGSLENLGKSVKLAEELNIPGYQGAFSRMRAEAKRIGSAVQGHVQDELTWMAIQWVGGRALHEVFDAVDGYKAAKLAGQSEKAVQMVLSGKGPGFVSYGSSKLSAQAVRFRIAENLLESGRNVAVIEYKTAQGAYETMELLSEARGAAGHTERMILGELQKRGVQARDVTRIYTEFQPCELVGCKTYLNKNFSQASVTWSFEYGGNSARNASRVIGKAAKDYALSGYK